MHRTVKKNQLNIFRRNNRRAFTLTEVIVAATLMAFVLVPILKALTQVNLNSVTIERKTQSLCLAQAKLNQIQAQSIYNFDAILSQSTEVTGSYICNTTSLSVNTDLKAITVSVTNNGINITLQTQVARRQ